MVRRRPISRNGLNTIPQGKMIFFKAKCDVKEIVCQNLKFAENLPSGHPKCTVDEFVSSAEQVYSNLALHHLVTNGSSVMNGCHQNESPNC